MDRADGYMTLDWLMENYWPGDEHPWSDDFRFLWTHDTEQMTRLVWDIATVGVWEPTLLGDDGRVWDGHHRIAAAVALGFDAIPVVHSRVA